MVNHEFIKRVIQEPGYALLLIFTCTHSVFNRLKTYFWHEKDTQISLFSQTVNKLSAFNRPEPGISHGGQQFMLYENHILKL